MSYYAQGFNPFQGQAGQQYPFQQTAHPPAPENGIFPGLPSLYPPAGYEPTRNTIPGLAFGAPQSNGSWQPVPPQAPSEPKLVPAAQYYQRDTARQNQAQPAREPNHSIDGTAEEGEISEGEYDDLYEPAETTVVHNAEGTDDYDPADPGWYTSPAQQQSSAPRRGSQSNNAVRERSGSYSPYLSPREIQPASDSPNSAHRAAIQTSEGSVKTSEQVSGTGKQKEDVVSDKKQAASAALQDLWSLDVRFRTFVEEGIDPSILRSLFGDLGLDASDAEAPASQIPGIPPTVSSESAQKTTTDAQTSANQKPPQQKPQQNVTASLSPESLTNKKAEERKDRIARLYAAKATKSETPTSTPSQPKPAQTEKELKLQQKMEALQKAREARAQKAASKKDTTAASKVDDAAAAPEPAVHAKKASSSTGNEAPAPTSRTVEPVPTTRPTPPSNSQNGVIPGLPMPTSALPGSVAPARKRPVASDFVDAPTGSSKRPFGQERKGRLVIDVSEGSDDEDVEMDMGSGDESVQAGSRPFTHRTASFRDVPPLVETSFQRQFSSPVHRKVATPPNDSAAEMDQEIERMRRKIALAEARQKLKMAMNKKEAATPKSNAVTPDALSETIAPKPPLRRVQSMEPPTVSETPAVTMTGRSSPVVLGAESSRLPKLSDIPRSLRENRQERFRTLSQTLPQLDGRLQAKTKKLRLLQSQIIRLEREIEQESTEKQQMEDELVALEAATTSEESEARDSPAVEPTTTEGAERSLSQQPPILPSLPTQVDAQDTEMETPSEPAVESSSIDVSAAVGETSVSVATSEPGEAQVEVSEAVSGDAMDEQLDSSDTSSGAKVSSEEVQEGESESDEGQVVDTEMGVDDSLEEQQEEGIADVPSARSGAQESQQATADAPNVPDQISLGDNDSVPDEGLGDVREVYPVGTLKKTTGLTTGQLRPPPVKTGFTPYKSALGAFREFRYHPSFTSQVPGGLRSLTYSNKIDPNQPLCPHELDGRQCPNGENCDFQHFDSMKLPDDQILLQLGATKLEGADRARFNGGLRELLQEMREQNVKDFPRIAQGIVDYHNRFNGDPSKILSLGDITL